MLLCCSLLQERLVEHLSKDEIDGPSIFSHHQKLNPQCQFLSQWPVLGRLPPLSGTFRSGRKVLYFCRWMQKSTSTPPPPPSPDSAKIPQNWLGRAPVFAALKP